MKQAFKPMSWTVKNFDVNAQKITDHDVLKYREDEIKKLKKMCVTKEEFAEKLRRGFRWAYGPKDAWELIIELTEDNRVLLKPWRVCYDEDACAIDVTDDTTFDWKGFSVEHIGEKVGVFSQLDYVWDDFISYCWDYHHKYQKNK